MHADPVADPGYTWGEVAGSKGSPRRIDYAYVGGPVEVESSEVVGEEGAADVDRGYARWTSDHRGVLSDLSVTPAMIPTTVALSSRMLTVGDAVTVTYRLPDGAEGGTVTLEGASTWEADVDDDAGTVEVDTADLAPGEYDVTLTDSSRRGRGPATSLYVRPEDARGRPDHGRDRRTPQGIPSPCAGPTVRRTGGSWIGVYRADAGGPGEGRLPGLGLHRRSRRGCAAAEHREGSMVLGREHQGKPWPLPPGRYVVHYLLTDQYVSAGTASFTVRGG